MIRCVNNNDVALAQRMRDREIMTMREPRSFMRAVSLPELHWVPISYQRSKTPIQTHYGVFGSGVNAYVLDTGVDITHEMFTGADVRALGFLPNAPANIDGHGHGTWLCGKIIEKAPQTSVFSLKVLDDNGTSLVANVNNALSHLISCPENKPHIIVLSIKDTERDVRMGKLIWQLSRQGVVVIVGGDGNAFANFDGVLAISTTDKTRNLLLPSVSEYSTHLALRARGFIGSYLNNTYRELNGATAHMANVAGILALGISYMKKHGQNEDRLNVLTQVAQNGELDEKSFLAALAERRSSSLASVT